MIVLRSSHGKKETVKKQKIHSEDEKEAFVLFFDCRGSFSMPDDCFD